MSTIVVYTGPGRIDLGLRHNMHFVSRTEIPELIKAVMDANSAFANFFEDQETFMRRPPPGSNAFIQAKVAQAPPVRRTLVHPPLRRHR